MVGPNHFDGGLINSGKSSHVIAAIQALLHSEETVEFLLSDDKHRKTCKSLLQCFMCSLYRVYQDMSNGMGNPVSLVSKWERISIEMPCEKQSSSLEVLSVFIDVMAFQHSERNPELNANEIDCHPLKKIWKNVTSMEVSCGLCGDFNSTKMTSVVELNNVVSNIESAINDSMLGVKEEICPQCQQETATIHNTEVAVGQCLVVQVQSFSETFTLPFELNLQGYKLSLKSVIMQQDGKPCVFISVCPDQKFRKFEDTQISVISPAKLFDPQFIKQSKLLLIFQEGKKKSLPQVHQVKINQSRTSMRKDKVQVVDFPDVSALDTSIPDVSSLEISHVSASNDTESFHHNTSVRNVKNAGTQTDTQTEERSFRDQGTQTGPFASFEFCKYSKKFEFFTGLNLEDFDALFNVIGGHEVISTLKTDYDAPTPVTNRETKLTSQDKLLMFLLRLRRGLPLEELSVIFDISVSWVGKLLYAITRLIYLTFKGMEGDMFPTAAQQRKNKPKKMRPFKNLRILLDGASFFIETPTNFEQQGNTFSKYKKHNVMLFSIGIACNGATIFCSDGMEGRMSDKGVILESGLLNRLSKGDGVMTDKGYELTAELKAIGCEFYKPPTKSENGFSAEEEILTKAIASARIYTEHAIADIKDNRLLRGTIPLTLLPVLGDLVYIAAYLRNFKPSRIRNRKFVVKESEC